MTITAGIDVGSTYTKCILLDDNNHIVAKVMKPTGFKLTQIASVVYQEALSQAGLQADDVSYIISTGVGRHQVDFKDLAVTDLTAAARGAMFFFPNTRTVLDIGGQTMKTTRVDENGLVHSFRLNDKCAAGTGAFLEKTARYMGFTTPEIGALLTTSRSAATISGVCAVFAESEVINQLSLGTPPADIMQGAIVSLVGRSAQLMKRAKAEPEFTLVGGILRFPTMAGEVKKAMKSEVNVPPEDLCQFAAAVGASVLGHKRLEIAARSGAGAEVHAP